jgi:hypothetical protein
MTPPVEMTMLLVQANLSSRPERTRISCHTALDMATCAAFVKESRMKITNATKLHRKSGVAEWRDLRCAFIPSQIRPQKAVGPRELSSPAYGLSLLNTWSFEISLNITNAAKISSTTNAAW